MTITNFLNDIYDKFQLIFDYHGINTEELSEQLEGIENTNETQQKITNKIQWLFQTNDSTYYIVGMLNDTMYFIDTEGGLSDSEYDLYNLPFLINSSPFDFFDSWKNNIESINCFLTYFKYCQTNSIILLPEHLLWQKQLLTIKSSI